jgi:hypothetical protein
MNPVPPKTLELRSKYDLLKRVTFGGAGIMHGISKRTGWVRGQLDWEEVQAFTNLLPSRKCV